jgi:signal transduction histidine kinase
MRDLRDGRPFRDHVVEARRARDGGRLWLSLSGRRFADGYWHGLGTDVTRREEALRFQAEAMEQATAGIQAKSQFLATMSHELRTPLNAIIGFSELLDAGYAGPLTDKQREYLADIRHSGAYLLDLVNDILDLSKAEAGRVEIADETIELASLVAEVLRIVAPQATAGGIALDMKIDPALPPVLGDARRIKQVLLNLVSNAVKFTPAGGRVEVSAALGADGSLALAITDTGIGMSESDIPRALERFGQIDSRLERRYAGTGIGLPLAKKLAELHGGSLTLESAVGVGTRATVMLPASRVAGPQLGTSPPSTL